MGLRWFYQTDVFLYLCHTNHQQIVRKRRRIRSSVDDKVLDGYFPPAYPGVLIAAEVKALVGTLRISVEELAAMLLPRAASRAIAPISGFKVGAICRGVSGNLYFGANVEFVGVPLHATVHAEQCGIANALAHGEVGVKAICVSAPPCGHCRQVINELTTASELTIQLPGQDPVPFLSLFPDGFGPEDLKVDRRLMDPQTQPMELVGEMSDALVEKALEAARSSYAPYSGNYAGVALEIRGGRVFCGIYAENAALNPSLLPMQAAIANLIINGCYFAEIKRAVLVQTQGTKIDLADISRQTLASVCNVPLEVKDGAISSKNALGDEVGVPG